MLRLLVYTVLALCLTVQHAQGGQYYWSTSRLILPGEPAIVYITKLTSDQSSTVDVLVALVKTVNGDEEIQDSVSQEIATGDCIGEELVLNVPSTLPTAYGISYAITVSFVLDGENIDRKEQVDVLDQPFSIAILTDKPIYKPGDTVQINIFGYDVNLLPILDPFNVDMYDNNDNLIKQNHDLSSTTGLHTLELVLGENADLGEYKIKATVGAIEEEKPVKVTEYVLPKFEVMVQPPSFIIVSQQIQSYEPFSITVKAMYTYGQPVEGEVVLRVFENCASSNYYGNEIECEDFHFTGTLADGEFTQEITVEMLGDLLTKLNEWQSEPTINDLLWRQIQATAEVTEMGTGVVLSGTSTLSIKSESLTVSVPESTPKNFMPGFDYSGQIKVTRVDGSPLTEADFNLPSGAPQQIRMTLTMQCPHFYGDQPDDLEPCEETILEDRYLQIPTTGLVDYTVDTEYLGTEFSSMYMQAHVMDQYGIDIHLTTSIPAYQSTSNAGLRVEQDGGFQALSVGSTLFRVTTTESIDKFYYEIYSKGSRVQQDCITSSGTSHTFTLVVDEILAQQMAPTSKLIVWYITDTNPELIADAVTISIVASEVFSNKVSVGFNTEEVEPSDSVTVSGNAKPDSIVGLLAIDISLTLLGSGNFITREDVLMHLNSYQGTSPPMFYPCMCWGGFFRRRKRSIWGGCLPPSTQANDVTELYRQSEVLAITNAIMHQESDYDPFYHPYEYDSSGDAFDDLEALYFDSPVHDYYDTSYHASEAEVSAKDVASIGDAEPLSSITETHYLILRKNKVADAPLIAFGETVAEIGGAENDLEVTASDSDLQPVTETRSNFVETWMFLTTVINADGTFSMTQEAPDTITTWVLSAFTLHPTYGIGVAETAELRVFKPFFVSLTMPYSVVRQEVFLLKITVFNYLDDEVLVQLTVAESTDFDITVNDDDPIQQEITTELVVSAQSGRTTEAWVKPKVLGMMPFVVTAKSAQAADQIRKEVLVKAEGVEQSAASCTIMMLTSDQTHEEFTVTPSFPENTVADSQRITVSIVGDVIGSSLQNIESLLKMPYGCGEQNMLNFAPNIFIMYYLEQTNQVTDAIRATAVSYMQKGYSGELKYKRNDASYSAFGQNDETGSTWLTAFVLKSFTGAIPYISVDLSLLEDTCNWLLSKKNDDGSFKKEGFVHHKDMMGGAADNNIALTAYVLVALLEYEKNEQTEVDVSSEVDDAVDFLEGKLNNQLNNDYYALALTTYALCLSGDRSVRRAEALEKLNDIAITSGDMKYWTTDGEAESSEEDDEDYSDYMYRYEPPSNDIEMTAYGLLATLACSEDNQEISDAIMIMRWLITKGNGLGGYGNTQATVMTLQALATFAEVLYGDSNTQNFNAEVMYGNEVHMFDVISDSNTLLVQKKELGYSPDAGPISVLGTGSGVAIVQVVWDYNVLESEESDYIKIDITTDTTNQMNNEVLTDLCVEWLADTDSGMVLVEAKALSGFKMDGSNLMEMYQESQHLKKVEDNGDQIVLYFDELSDEKRCLQLVQMMETPVANMQPAVVKSYAYYQTDKMKVVEYIPEVLSGADRCTVSPASCGIIFQPSGATSHTVSMTTMAFVGALIYTMMAFITRD